ncbi:hypothetical protein BDV24DRAFT_162226 [Aspergillus arachidicola]|uniref:Uncharacterized protein n=1 Tax=Aspergillus arachidicola TaxID=656916 RepID=A0A5N6YB60_9EURO|nr:hypothetical protein BDV24DRAFT_162226 [Aspergillus arachidicola]
MERANGSMIQGNQLKQMKKTRKGHWNTPAEDDTGNETAYCMGCLRVEMPSAMLGYLSSNCKTQDLSRTDHVMMGSTVAICTFPEIQSVAVVMANGLQTGDASDYSAWVVIQALLNLQPLDFYILESLRTMNIHFV